MFGHNFRSIYEIHTKPVQSRSMAPTLESIETQDPEVHRVKKLTKKKEVISKNEENTLTVFVIPCSSERGKSDWLMRQ